MRNNNSIENKDVYQYEDIQIQIYKMKLKIKDFSNLVVLDVSPIN